MIHKYIVVVAALFIAAPTFAQKDIKSDKEKLSYAIGYQFGLDIKNKQSEVDVKLVEQAMKDAVSGMDPLVPEDEMRQELQNLQKRAQEDYLVKLEKLAEDNKVKSEAFLSNNRSKENITVLQSGVQYRIIEKGQGKRPTLEDTVLLNVRGMLATSDREFFSSYSTGQPVPSKISDSLPGWQEVLPLMKVGAKWQVFLPPELAFGERGNGRDIGPNEAIHFDLEILEIEKK